MQRDKYQLSLFAMTPKSQECKAFLKIEQEEAMIEAQIAQAMKKKQLLKLQQANKSEKTERHHDCKFVIIYSIILEHQPIAKDAPLNPKLT